MYLRRQTDSQTDRTRDARSTLLIIVDSVFADVDNGPDVEMSLITTWICCRRRAELTVDR